MDEGMNRFKMAHEGSIMAEIIIIKIKVMIKSCFAK